MTYDRRSPPDTRPRRLLLANASRARLLERDPDTGSLRELASHVHTASRMKAAELGRDRSGEGVTGASHAAFAPATDLREREREHFAHELAGQLEAEARANRLPHWALMASSPFLGRLRAELGPLAAASLVLHAEVDLTALPLHELEPRLRSLLPPGPAAAG